ncbi:peptidase [Staphylococcus condimenti]|nr:MULTISPECIES: peptidase [Staphylococcus]MDK8645409.1 peptidase [Staphylococcus condimenti]VEG65403.1 Zn-dependent proteases [Staphylococcus condimenti]
MYYRNSVGAIEPNIINMLTDYPEKVNKCSFYTYIFFLVVMVFINNIYVLNLQENIEPKINNSILLFVILYFLMNIIFHELGHIYSLKFFGRKIDKVGFKLNFYVFPAFYVQMNETYMLSQIDKIIVHSFGLFVNFALINFIQLLNILIINNISLTLSYMLFSSTMIWNLVPMLNSDGYKIMLALLSLDEFSNFTKNHWLVLIFQIIGVSIALNTLIHWVIYWSEYLFL